MDLRHCRWCGRVKGADEFYASTPTRCKECGRSSAARRRAENLESIRALDRARAALPHRKLQNATTTAQWRTAKPREYKAQTALNNAIRDGKVQRWPVCAVPECNKKPVAHHPNYDAPLDVVWLCQAHHKQAHALVREAA